jgi:hypothetical protein
VKFGVPFGRLGISDLASAGSGLVLGAEITVDGGDTEMPTPLSFTSEISGFFEAEANASETSVEDEENTGRCYTHTALAEKRWHCGDVLAVVGRREL